MLFSYFICARASFSERPANYLMDTYSEHFLYPPRSYALVIRLWWRTTAHRQRLPLSGCQCYDGAFASATGGVTHRPFKLRTMDNRRMLAPERRRPQDDGGLAGMMPALPSNAARHYAGTILAPGRFLSS